MSAADYQACEDRVLAHEGSEYTDGVHPYDPGGPTRWGITIFDARSFWKKNATADDVRIMPREVAVSIYRTKYWAVVNGDQLPAGIDDCIFDYGVNSGNSRAGKVLRRLLALPDTDWHVTDEVIAACRKRDPITLINAICDERIKFLEGLAIWPTYRKGWAIRVSEVRQFSTQLAGHEASPVSVPAPVPPTIPVGKGKGAVSKPNPGVIVKNGGGATLATGGIAHWLGAHPSVTALIIVAGAIAIFAIVSMLQRSYQTKQDAPVPGIAPVPEAK